MNTEGKKRSNGHAVGVRENGFVEQRGGDPKHISAILRQIKIALISKTAPADIHTEPRQN